MNTAIVILVAAAATSAGMEIRQTSPTQRVVAGDTVFLLCQADSYFEFCVWRHKSLNCEFEWKKSHEAVRMQRCSEGLKDRASFVGNYERHECVVELRGVEAADAGEWSCEMESYVWGPARGATSKAQVRIEVAEEEKGKTTTEKAGKEDISDFIPVVFETETTTTSTSSSSTEQSDDSTSTPTYLESTNSTTDEPLTEDHINRFHNLSVLINAHEDAIPNDGSNDIDGPDASQRSFSADEATDADSNAGTPYVGIILGSFGALFVIMVVVVFFLYRQKRRDKLEVDWREKRASQIAANGKSGSTGHKVELSNIIEDVDDDEVNVVVKSEDVEAGNENEESNGSSRMTYNGVRATSSFDDPLRQ